MTEIISHHSCDGICLYVSPNCSAVFGYLPEELVGRSAYDFFHPDDVSLVRKAHSTVLEQPVRTLMTFRLRGKDGAYLWLESHVRAMRDPHSAAIQEIIAVSRTAGEREQGDVRVLQPSRSIEDAVDRITDGFFVLDRDWRITYANAQAERIARQPREVLIGQSIWSAFPAAVGSIFDEKYREAMTTQVSQHFEAYYPPLDVWVDVRADPTPEGLAILFHDITDRKRHELALIDSRRFLQSTLDSLSAHVAILDEIGTIIAVNDAWRGFAAENELRSPEHEVGTNYLAVCDAAAKAGAEGAAEVAAGIRAVMAKERDSFSWEYPCHSPTEQRWFIVRVTRFHDSDPPRVVISHENITAQRQAELAQAAAESRYRTLFEEIGDIILIADAEGRYVDANAAASRLLGYTREEFLQLAVADIVADSPSWTTDEYARFKDDGSWQGELELRRKDGHHVPVEAHAIVLNTPPELLYVSVIRDISERRAAERMQQEFLSMITHDLRTPLTSIRGFAQLMQRQQAYRESAVRQITTQVDQLQRLIADLADVTRIRTGALEVQRARAELLSIARAAVDASRTLTQRHQIHLAAPAQPIVGYWDSVRVTQVLQNLLANAIKYSPDGGEIRLRVTEHAGEVLVAVEDQGIGIDPGDLNHLFNPFFRSESAGNTATGLGLGLAISKAVIDSHGGRIWVESVPGQGSIFFFTLPTIDMDSI